MLTLTLTTLTFTSVKVTPSLLLLLSIFSSADTRRSLPQLCTRYTYVQNDNNNSDYILYYVITIIIIITQQQQHGSYMSELIIYIRGAGTGGASAHPGENQGRHCPPWKLAVV